ncbi:hypothetical protein ACFO25_17535 [Paenactinomyces guangxiensis]|uniref:Uncharacterized protein n=1 Tax=Paenactinomyces guangxiensis TaxID=1490290 RepID=A0A7W2A7N0_9BACL|nr:hypothetical protein [Paenactinomyces guangxiensis]MBA4494731.1 hypothetical protein [Paenactinomyces guangxiensis]MBH8591815.1 hypothetical protein [Paenactinomyces guangxiensis]
MSTIGPVLIQLFSFLAIILPVLGGVLAILTLWRMMKALEGIRTSLEVLIAEKGRNAEERPNK